MYTRNRNVGVTIIMYHLNSTPHFISITILQDNWDDDDIDDDFTMQLRAELEKS